VFAAAYRHIRTIVAVVAILIASVAVSLVAVDVGPSLRARAEREGSKWLDRPMHIGRLGVEVGRGRFVVEDLVIEGLTPDARPWLTARRIDISLTWSAILGREILFDSIEMTDWRMVVETFGDGRHNWPRVNGPPRKPRTGPRPVVSTLQYVRAHRGEFVFDDHGARWGVVAPKLDVTVTRAGEYRGTAEFHDGTIHFAEFLPMAADMATTFKIQGGKIVLDNIDLTTDGAVSKITGVVDAGRWPEMLYQVKSRVQFPRMREIFFPRDSFALHGEGDFTGTFHLFKGGRELKGDFFSREAGLNDYRFQDLEGSLIWVPERFEVTRASSGFFGGQTRFKYLMAPLGNPRQKSHGRFDVEYENVDLEAFTNFQELRGLRLAGLASGRNVLDWPMGRFAERTGGGTIAVTPPSGVLPMSRDLSDVHLAAAGDRGTHFGPFSNHLPLGPVPIAGAIEYSYNGANVHIASAEIATEDTFVTVSGDTTFRGEGSRLPFHVTSASWQESDRLLAGIMTAFGSPTRAQPFDGAGEFDGVMTGPFRRPRVEGRLRGREMQAFDVTWGDVEGDVVIENSYANVSRASIVRGPSRIDVQGLFSLGYPRRDGGEEINARIKMDRRPIADLLNAFDIEDYPVTGILSGDFHIYGPYTRPFGVGEMRIDAGTAYGEPFSTATAALTFEGNGVRLTPAQIEKGGGHINGAAFVGWNGTYSFNADGRGLAVETLNFLTLPDLPQLNGLADFTATGNGTFDQPRYEVKLGVHDLFFGEEGIGQVTGRLAVRDAAMIYELEAASPRLAVSGTGRIALNEDGDAEMSFRVTDTSIDPYVRAFQPTLSPYATATASGTIRVNGKLYNRDALRVETTVELLDLRLLDYRLRNQGPLNASMQGDTLNIDTLRLVGEDTALNVNGSVDLSRQALSLQADGAANLAALQGFIPDLRSSGRADVSALIGGTVQSPIVSGQALITEGRLRHFSLPHAIEELNGIATFNAGGIRVDGLTGKLGGGPVTFAGRIGLSGYQLSEFDLTATGQEMRLRFPEGMRSVIDATLALQGPASGPVLSGTVNVKNASWTRGFSSGTSMFSLGGSDDSGLPAVPGALAPVETFPLRYDIRIIAPSTLRIENDQARIVARADMNLRGTFDRPQLLGRAEIERGEVQFEDRRYFVTRGSLDFTNPNQIQPFFDVEAETRVRVPGQTYRVTLRLAGTTERLQPEFTSDPPLAPIDVLTLLFSDTPPSGDIELASLRQPNQREQDLLQARATRALTGALSEEVGKVVEQTFGVDTFQITPLLVDPYQQSSRLNVNPAARVTIGKRISDRVYLTYARSLSASTRDEIILLEFDQSDRLAWVLSQNEDRTYALEVRKRHTF
jgi:hypothetical protein